MLKKICDRCAKEVDHAVTFWHSSFRALLTIDKDTDEAYWHKQFDLCEPCAQLLAEFFSASIK